MDVQQGQRPLPATGGERLARPDEPPRNEIIDIAIGELRLYFPQVREATPGEGARDQGTARHVFGRSRDGKPPSRRPESGLPKVFLAGDWTRTGWPATMEGAVRSGYLAAEAVSQVAGKRQTFLIPDIA